MNARPSNAISQTLPETSSAGALAADQAGATTLEWSLLLAAVAIPSYWTIQLAMEALVGHYQMMTLLNSVPFP